MCRSDEDTYPIINFRVSARAGPCKMVAVSQEPETRNLFYVSSPTDDGGSAVCPRTMSHNVSSSGSLKNFVWASSLIGLVNVC